MNGGDNAMVVAHIEPIRTVISVITRLILSDGSVLELVTEKNDIMIPIAKKYIELTENPCVKGKLNDLITLTCCNCFNLASVRDSCCECSEKYCKACRKKLRKDDPMFEKKHKFIK